MQHPEAKIKCAVIEHLRSNGSFSDDAVLVNEMVVGKGVNRVDLVVAAGETIAFEIKSSRDRLTRLPSQVAAFREVFDKTVVVVDECHLEASVKILPRTIEIWSAKQTDEYVTVDVLRPGRRNVIKDKGALIQILTVAELKHLMSVCGVKSAGDTRSDLEQKAIRLPLKRLREAVLYAIKTRFYDSNAAFHFEIGRGPVTPESLGFLSRYRSTRNAPLTWSYLIGPDPMRARVTEPTLV